MKKVVLSACCDSVVYSVPDVAADNPEEYCLVLCSDWLHHGPDTEKI